MGPLANAGGPVFRRSVLARQHLEIQYLSGNLWTNVLRFAYPVALTSILEQLSSLIIVLFLRVFLLGMPSVLLYNFEAAILRADGDAQFPMQALCPSAVMNVVLDLLFIGVFGWGVVGSAIAIDLCYTTIAVLLSVRLLHLDSPVRIDSHRLHVD